MTQKTIDKNIKTTYPVTHLQNVPRNQYFQMVSIALETGEFGFAKEAVSNWLSEFPGDLGAILVSARLHLSSRNPELAIPILTYLIHTDPENLETTRVFLQAFNKVNIHQVDGITPGYLQTALFLLTNAKEATPVEDWGMPILNAWRTLAEPGNLKGEQFFEIFRIDPGINVLTAITYIQLLQRVKQQNNQPPIDLLEGFSKQFPNCLFIKLTLAEAMMTWGNHIEAVSLLNEVVSKDTTGRVISRMWGKNHAYRSMWPEGLVMDFNSWIPYKIAYRLGWNVLPEGDFSMGEITRISDELVEKNINQLNKNQRSSVLGSSHVKSKIPATGATTVATTVVKNENIQFENRLPVYIVFSSKIALEEKFGRDGARLIQQEMRRLCAVLDKISGWKSIFFTPDDPAQAASFNLNLAKAGDAWSMKLAITDLEKVLGSRGERIGALLIVGGPDIIPFHLLPNPINDPDEVVPSDNPYASADENYYIPDWPIGRIPDGQVKTPGLICDPDFLIKSLQNISRYNASINNCPSWYQRIFQPFSPRRIIKGLWNGFQWSRVLLSGTRSFSSFGYVASVWEKVSGTVFTPIGKSKSLLVSPPFGLSISTNGQQTRNTNTNPIDRLLTQNRQNHRLIKPPRITSQLAYFNLHGVEDSGEWYGQRSPQDSEQYPDYPIALKPDDITEGRSWLDVEIPEIIFSEACYGAHIIDKEISDAISLSFIRSGSKAMVGSTSMSYGSVSEPLIAADFLGHSFWMYLKEGFPVGEALQRAKVQLAQIMLSRQGHLDGEDQKTLISFILLGDPLAYPAPHQKCPEATWRPPDQIKQIKTISDADFFEIDWASSSELSEDMVNQVKSIVSRYLPGMVDAKFYVGIEKNGKDTKEGKELNQYPAQQISPDMKENKLGKGHKRITLSKQYKRGNKKHTQVALLTLTESGRLLKLVVSR